MGGTLSTEDGGVVYASSLGDVIIAVELRYVKGYSSVWVNWGELGESNSDLMEIGEGGSSISSGGG